MQDELQLLAPSPVHHRAEMFDLIAKCFPHPDFYSFRARLREGYLDDSHYDWSVGRIGVLDGHIVTHYGVWDYQMRIGAARVRTAGIGVVATDGNCRGHGLMDKTARASIAAMRPAGYDFSLLFGISNFYHRFGYTRAWSDTSYFVPVSELPTEKPAGTITEFEPAPRADLAQLYNRAFAATTGTAVRPTYRAALNLRKEVTGFAWKKAGVLAGYVFIAFSGQRAECHEAVGDAEQVLRVIGLLARQRHCTEVRFDPLPIHSDLARRLRQGSCRAETHYVRCGGAMIRTINLSQALSKMTGVLAERLASSPLKSWQGTLALANAEESAALQIARGRIKVCPGGRSVHRLAAGDELSQFLLGTDAPAEIIARGQTRCRGAAAELAEVLFPAQHPILHAADRY